MDERFPELARRNGEPLPGSVKTIERLILLTWPKKWWAAEPKHSQHLPPEFLAWFEERQQRGESVSLRLVWREGLPEDRFSLLAFPAGVEYSRLRAEDLAPTLERLGSGGKVLSGRELLVCTHGGHNPCCGKFGTNLLDALGGALPGSDARFRLWESSHIGGCRFSANCLVLPEGDCYGQMQDAAAGEFLRAVADDEVYAPQWRGNLFREEQDQLALAAGYRFCHERGIRGEILPIEATYDDPDHGELYVEVYPETGADLRLRTLVVSVERRTFVGPDSCKSLDTSKAVQRWVISDVQDIAEVEG